MQDVLHGGVRTHFYKDYFLVSEYSQDQIDTFDIIPSIQSDH